MPSTTNLYYLYSIFKAKHLLLMSVPAAYSVPVTMFHHCKLHCGFYINLEEAKNILDTGSTEVNNGN